MAMFLLGQGCKLGILVWAAWAVLGLGFMPIRATIRWNLNFWLLPSLMCPPQSATMFNLLITLRIENVNVSSGLVHLAKILQMYTWSGQLSISATWTLLQSRMIFGRSWDCDLVLSKISSIFTVVDNPHTLRASLGRTRTGSEIKNEIKTGTKTEIKTVRRPRTKTRRTMCDRSVCWWFYTGH